MTSTRPLINSAGIPPQSGGVNANGSYGSAFRGKLPNGLGVVVDNNVPTNLGTGTKQDEIYVVNSQECHLWEAPNSPVFIRAEQPSAYQLGVQLVVYCYFAYTFARYANAMQKVGGTAFTTPVF